MAETLSFTDPLPLHPLEMILYSSSAHDSLLRKVGRFVSTWMSLPPFDLAFFFRRDQVGGEVVPLILLYPLLEVFIRFLIHKIKQVYLHRHIWLGIGKTCYNKAISLPFGVVMTEEWSIKRRGSNPRRCFLWWCEVSGEWFKAWQGWHIRCHQTSKGERMSIDVCQLTNKDRCDRFLIDNGNTLSIIVRWQLYLRILHQR